MKHTDKLKMARGMMTPKEISNHVAPFQSAEWDRRKEVKLNKQINQGKKNEKSN